MKWVKKNFLFVLTEQFLLLGVRMMGGNTILLKSLQVWGKIRKMYNFKKGQISDTLSWIIATVVIVSVLGIPILLIQLDMINTKRISFERVQDTIATKSISGYLLKNYEWIGGNEWINKFEGNEKKLSLEQESEIESLLRSLCTNGLEGWSLILLFNEEAVYHKGFYKYSDLRYIVYDGNDWRNYFVRDNKKFDTKFYFDNQGNKLFFDFYNGGELIKG